MFHNSFIVTFFPKQSYMPFLHLAIILSDSASNITHQYSRGPFEYGENRWKTLVDETFDGITLNVESFLNLHFLLIQTVPYTASRNGTSLLCTYLMCIPNVTSMTFCCLRDEFPTLST